MKQSEFEAEKARLLAERQRLEAERERLEEIKAGRGAETLEDRWRMEEQSIMAGAIRREAEIVARLKAARERKEINSTEAN